ncbi:hypothetical protein FPV16_21875 [Methylobacterium sp. W2]|uniref:hypothetical protein n=1 Tax=Methylobacterium sp. W2 TaxID=2598107 RepID=UPI001D0CA248|nr:hypothetical protein [Methylobacterium sp. W2]MCC0808821.1 hypothetical protein [Methylobacterium sp. W2]
MSGGAAPARAVTIPILAEAARMVRSLREAARAAGVLPGDPMAVLIEALAQAIGFLGHQRAALAGTAEDVTERLGAILHDGREVADAEAERFRAECQATEAETVRSLSTVLANTAERALTNRVRALDRRTATLVGVAVAGALALGVGGGWWVGDRSARANITATEDNVRTAFRNGPETAQLWADLMTWNNVHTAVVRCRDSGQIREESGRRVCNLLLWVSAPPAVPTQ